MFWRDIAHKRIKDNKCPYCKEDYLADVLNDLYSVEEPEYDRDFKELRVEIDATCTSCKGSWLYVVKIDLQSLIEHASKLWVHSEDYPHKEQDAGGQQKICL